MLFLYIFCAFVSFSQTDPEKCGAVQLRQQLFTVTRFDGSEPGCSGCWVEGGSEANPLQLHHSSGVFRSFYIYLIRAD